ncbi:MAG: hypothetical protein GY788_16685 [bacterium]|nr:hypothetical protein [bacterium]
MTSTGPSRSTFRDIVVAAEVAATVARCLGGFNGSPSPQPRDLERQIAITCNDPQRTNEALQHRERTETMVSDLGDAFKQHLEASIQKWERERSERTRETTTPVRRNRSRDRGR